MRSRALACGAPFAPFARVIPHRAFDPRLIASTLTLALLASGCAAEDMVDPGGDGDNNDEAASVLTALDTSFLIPAPSSGKPFLPVSTKGKGGALLEEAKFGTLHDKAEYNSTDGGPGGISGDRKAVYDATAVVGFRYDPCAPEAFHGEVPVAPAECRHELRLVAQPSAG